MISNINSYTPLYYLVKRFKCTDQLQPYELLIKYKLANKVKHAYLANA